MINFKDLYADVSMKIFQFDANYHVYDKETLEEQLSLLRVEVDNLQSIFQDALLGEEGGLIDKFSRDAIPHLDTELCRLTDKIAKVSLQNIEENSEAFPFPKSPTRETANLDASEVSLRRKRKHASEEEPKKRVKYDFVEQQAFDEDLKPYLNQVMDEIDGELEIKESAIFELLESIQVCGKSFNGRLVVGSSLQQKREGVNVWLNAQEAIKKGRYLLDEKVPELLTALEEGKKVVIYAENPSDALVFGLAVVILSKKVGVEEAKQELGTWAESVKLTAHQINQLNGYKLEVIK